MKTSIFARFSKIVGAWSLLTIFNFAYDSIAYPIAIWKFGPLYGGGFMAILAIMICFFMLIVYEKSGHDWLGINVVEQIKSDGHKWVRKLRKKARRSIVWFIIRLILWLPSHAFLIVLWMIKKNDVLAFLALSLYQDPFITTVFLRHGRFNGLRRKDWMILLLSSILANGYWIARNYALVEVIRAGYKAIT
jgi:hypothetical protein